ncbi:hypothetical protein RND71_038068 [Anisodus tanguticus]|uniref:Uncharacterized protein n=1 Tax=Anisodus tanguticus TaxID=243964 RepID=A0AAE1R1J9_9SOLA|nr:hypothetical protein RND71_038068 [Anisodus tanguticus]
MLTISFGIDASSNGSKPPPSFVSLFVEGYSSRPPSTLGPHIGDRNSDKHGSLAHLIQEMTLSSLFH